MRKEEKKTRHDLGREEFVRRVWSWKEKHGGIIIEQLKRLGCSCDWSRERFTMDEAYSRAVQQTFVDLYRKGFIYRGRRMVNWDPVALTALSDEEVIPTPQKSSLYYVRYELVDEPGRFLEVATTRPETIMADVALAVQPNDERYSALLGKKVWRPLDRAELPIIGDEAIDPDFGTGVLKVTPAHDKVDFEIGQRHDLPVIDVLHPNGKINCPNVPELDGLDRFAARKKAAEMLSEAGLLAKEEPHESTVGFSERAGVPIEPRLSEQWFLKYPKVAEARAAVGEGRPIRFRPERWEKCLPALAREHSGLVHQPAALVGPSHPGLVHEGRSEETAASTSSRLTTRRTGNRTPTCSTPGSRAGSGLSRRWTLRRGQNFTRRAIS